MKTPTLLLAATLLMCAAAGAVSAATPQVSAAAAGEIDPASIYQVESRWTRADGEKIALASLRGKVRVLAIFYSACEYACPIIIGRIKSVEASLPDKLRSDVGFVLVSMDPAHDDPAQLRAYAERMELKGDWTLLHGSDDDVRELAALLGFRYRQEKDGGYSHSNMITVLDAEGRIVKQSIGLDADAGDVVEAVTSLVAHAK
ncbi:MAG TPA: SCO family protein [Candidatus Limnocylindrales bacterium]|nr:SCO family protein [Candidatus Limnocylindrales bacterium]